MLLIKLKIIYIHVLIRILKHINHKHFNFHPVRSGRCGMDTTLSETYTFSESIGIGDIFQSDLFFS